MLESASRGGGGSAPGEVWSGGCLFLGGSGLWGGGVSAPGGVLVPGGISQHALRQTPPVDRHTPVKILPWPNFVAAGKDKSLSSLQTVRLKWDYVLRRSGLLGTLKSRLASQKIIFNALVKNGSRI